MRYLSLLAIAVLILAMPAQAATVVFDNFNRSGGLNGSAPTISPGLTWTTTTAAFTTDGSKVVPGGSLFLQAAHMPLPVTITSGSVYTISATTFYDAASSDDTGYMMFGFFDNNPVYDASTTFDHGNAIAIGPRNNRNAVANVLDGHAHPSDFSAADGTNGNTYGVRLYESSPGSWVADAVELAPHAQVISPQTSVNIAPLAKIGMISASTNPPFLDNFTFESSLHGDVNLDNHVDARDIAAMESALTNLSAYATSKSASTLQISSAGDVNGDGKFTGADLQKLLNVLKAGGGSSGAVPEPSTLVLLLLGSFGLIACRR